MNSGPLPPPPRRQLPPPPKPAQTLSGQASGWYQDPWDAARWRWWDGTNWTANVGGPPPPEKKPRLPAWLSPPVVAAAVPGIPMIVMLAVILPLSIPLGFVPMLLVAPVLIWIDRVEPEPWTSRIHALLWGGFVGGLIGLASNTAVAAISNESVAAVVSAPMSEEIGKGLGILWAIRRKEVDSVMDGIVYAGWVALGFAIIEDFSYFAQAGDSGELVQTVIGRALLTPFAHPLFTAWTGLALGRALVANRSLITAWWGLALAIGCHALWNGSLVLSGPTDNSPDGNVALLGITMVLFVALFIAVVLAVIALRKRDERRFSELVPALAQRYALPPADIAQYGNRRAMLKKRKSLPRSDRKAFDRRHAAIARLAALQDRTGEVDPSFEARLVTQLSQSNNG